MSLSYLLDIANIIYFAGSISQMKATFSNRKKSLKAVSYLMLSGYLIGGIMFAIANLSFGAVVASVLNSISCTIYGLQIYWKLRGNK